MRIGGGIPVCRGDRIVRQVNLRILSLSVIYSAKLVGPVFMLLCIVSMIPFAVIYAVI